VANELEMERVHSGREMERRRACSNPMPARAEPRVSQAFLVDAAVEERVAGRILNDAVEAALRDVVLELEPGLGRERLVAREGRTKAVRPRTDLDSPEPEIR